MVEIEVDNVYKIINLYFYYSSGSFGILAP